MHISWSTLLQRYLTVESTDCESRRRLFTLLLILDQEDIYKELDDDYMTEIDNIFVSDLLRLASPCEAAALLWGTVGQRLKPMEFAYWLEHLSATAADFRTLHQIGGAAYDFARKHPGKIQIPTALVRSLLNAVDSDSKVIGAKLLLHGHFSFLDISAALQVLLTSHVHIERLAALFVLVELLDPILREGGHILENASELLSVRSAIQYLESTSTSLEVRSMATQVLAQMDELQSLLSRA